MSYKGSDKKINRKNWNNNHNYTKKSTIYKGGKSRNTLLTPNEVAGVKEKREYHSALQVNVKEIAFNETEEVCPLCGEKILNIVDVFSRDGKYIHFPCAIDQIKKDQRVREDEIVSYVGSGNFGIYRKDDNGNITLSRKVLYESKEENESYKEYLESLKIWK